MDTYNLPDAEITGVKFVRYTDADIRLDAPFVIQNADLLKNGIPVTNGLYDPHMGVTSFRELCPVCKESNDKCLGHFARLNMIYPYYQPMQLREIKNMMRIFCFNCKRIAVDDIDKYYRQPTTKRINKMATDITNSNRRICSHCGAIRPRVDSVPTNKTMFVLKYFDGKKHIVDVPIYPHIVKRIFDAIPDSVTEILRIDSSRAPRHNVLMHLLVPPCNIRPDNSPNANATEQTGNPEMTHLLMIIARKTFDQRNRDGVARLMNISFDDLFRAKNYTEVSAEALRIKSAIDSQMAAIIQEMDNINLIIYTYECAPKSANANTTQLKIQSRHPESIAHKIPGKHGIIRHSAQATRADNTNRDVIRGDNHTPMDSILMPQYIASINKIEEHVREFNFNRLMIYFLNGRTRKYPYYNLIVRNGRRFEHEHIYMRDDFMLQIGDIIYRDVVDGDWETFNRQPSLTESAITGEKIIVNRNARDNSTGINANKCKLYAADFDGDTMTGSFVGTKLALAEIIFILSTAAHLISPQTSRTMIGMIQDGIIGSAALTRAARALPKYYAMSLFRNTKTIAYLPEDRTYTGRELMSMILPKGINYKGIPSSVNAKGDLSAYMYFDPSDKVLLIENGVIKSGIIDNASIGAGAGNSLYQTITCEINAARALKVMFDMQQMAIEMIDAEGLTMSPYDYELTPSSTQMIKDITDGVLTRAQEQLDKLITRQIKPAIGVSVSEHMENLMIATLRGDYIKPILLGVPRASSIVNMILTGAKGKIVHIEQLVAAVGQVLINAQRPAKNFGYKRTSPYTTKYSIDPRDNGYIKNSLIEGITTMELIFSCMGDRYNLITKALMTSVAGTSSRESRNSLESNTISYIFRLVTKGDKFIFGFTYGPNNYDCKKVEYVTIDHIVMSNDAFEKKFGQTPVRAEYDQLMTDRAVFRRNWCAQESIALQPVSSNSVQVPIHARRLVIKLKVRENAADCPADEMNTMIEMVASYCRNELKYCMFNRKYMEAKRIVPDFVQMACQKTAMHLREVLNSNTYLGQLNPDSLRRLLDIYSMYVKNAFIAPGSAVGIIASQSFSEPVTQNNLSATNSTAQGGATKTGMDRVKSVLRAKEITDAQMQIKLLDSVKNDNILIEEILSHIELLLFRVFVTRYQIFYEKFGEPVHPKYADEREMIEKFVKLNVIMPPPINLSGWCMRLELSQDMMLIKKIGLVEITKVINRAMPNTYCVYNSENSKNIVLRVYTSDLNTSTRLTNAEAYINQILDLPLRGIRGIKSATVMSKAVRGIDPVTGEMRMIEDKYIITQGSNIAEVASVKGIDPSTIQSDSITEMMRMYGIEVARQKIINELKGLVGDINEAHLMMYADEMCNSSNFSSIARGGVESREANNTLLLMSNMYPLQNLATAVTKCHTSKVYGVSGPILLGRKPNYGTASSQVVSRIYKDQNEIQAPISITDGVTSTVLDDF